MSTVLTTAEQVDAVLTSRFGKQEIAKMEKRTTAEAFVDRQALVSQVEKIEAERDGALVDLNETCKAANERYDAARKEFIAASCHKNAMKRKRSSLCSHAEGKINKLHRQLRETADPRIADFWHKTFQLADAVQAEGVRTQERRTDRPGKAAWAIIAEKFSNKPSLDEKIEAIREAREAAKLLEVAAVKDVGVELAKIREAIPRGTSLVKVDEYDVAG